MENFALFLALMVLFGIPIILVLAGVIKSLCTRKHCKGCKCKRTRS